MADFTITVTVAGGQLKYDGAGKGGKTKGAKRHRVFPASDAFWTSPEGDVSIRFKGSTRQVFEPPNNGPIKNIGFFARQSPAGGPPILTPRLTVKSKATSVHSTPYSVCLVKGGVPFIEDPDFEDGPDGGGPPRKKAAKKAAAKKKK